MQLNASDLGDSNVLFDELDKLAAESIDDIQPREIKDVVIPVEIHPDPPPKNEPKPEPKRESPKPIKKENKKGKHRLPRKPQMKISLDDLPPVVLPSSPLSVATQPQSSRNSPVSKPIVTQSIPQATETIPKTRPASIVNSIESNIISYLDNSLKNLKESFKEELEGILSSSDSLNLLIDRFSKRLASDVRSEIIFRAEPYKFQDLFDIQIEYTRPNYRLYSNTVLPLSVSEIKARQVTYKNQIKSHVKEFRTTVHNRNQAIREIGQKKYDLRKKYREDLAIHYSMEAKRKIIDFKLKRMRERKNDIISRISKLETTENTSADELVSDIELSESMSPFFAEVDAFDSENFGFARQFIDGELEDQMRRRELVRNDTDKFLSLLQEAADTPPSFAVSRLPESRSIMGRTVTGDSLMLPLTSFVY